MVTRPPRAGVLAVEETAASGAVRWLIGLHGVAAEVVAPGDPFARLLPLPLGAYDAVEPDAPVDVRIAIAPDDGPDVWAVSADGFDYHGIRGAAMAARRAEWAFADATLRRLRSHVHVHAAVVATAERSALLVGRSGRGKSTTSVGLAQVGLALYADDVALVDPATRRPLAFPRPVKLDAGSRALLRRLGLSIPSAARLHESVARSALPGLPPIDRPGPPLTAAVFFAEERRDRPELRPLTAAEGVLRTVGQSATERLSADGPSPGVLALINAVRCYELVVGEIEATVRLVADLVSAEPASNP